MSSGAIIGIVVVVAILTSLAVAAVRHVRRLDLDVEGSRRDRESLRQIVDQSDSPDKATALTHLALADGYFDQAESALRRKNLPEAIRLHDLAIAELRQARQIVSPDEPDDDQDEPDDDQDEDGTNALD